ncbi:MAG: type II toxin-antitoxin system VapC family toxin [Deltaproteobacteria bacterium]|nr:type II toxin-antitoxin system VapC family toxin [Deltaproteobacteria bacterium]
MILVDADMWIDFFSGVEPGSSVVQHLLEEKKAALSAVSVFELLAGVTGRKRIAQIRNLVSVVPVVRFSTDEAVKAASLYTELKAKGALVGNQDLFVAATALQLGVNVATRNRSHFGRIPGLKIMSPTEA